MAIQLAASLVDFTRSGSITLNNGSLRLTGDNGYYSSSVAHSSLNNLYLLLLNSDHAYSSYYNNRSSGCSLRCQAN